MLIRRCKKLLAIIFIGIFLLFGHAEVFADTSLRDYRKGLLDQMRRETKISHQVKKGKHRYFIVNSKHFDILIDDMSLGHFNLTRGKELEDLMLRIGFILEEVHQVVREAFGTSTKGRHTIYCMSEEAKGNSDITYYTSGRMEIPLSKDLMVNPLDDFSEGISRFYEAYVRWYLVMVMGPGFRHQDSQQITNYFIEIGQKASFWKQDITAKGRNDIIKSIDEQQAFLFKKYPQYFKNKLIDRNIIRCKWCKKEVDVTGKKKGQRILCPHCRNPIFVE